MINKNTLVALSILITLSACSNHSQRVAEAKESFITKITPDGLKLFSYTLSTNIPDERSAESRSSKGSGTRGGGRGGRGGRGGGGGKGGGGKGGIKSQSSGSSSSSRNSRIEQIKVKVDERLKLKLKETGYCRKGYIELDSYMSSGKFQIRGECEEGATPEDRVLFINNPKSV